MLWLQEYIQNYPKTVLLVSHDRCGVLLFVISSLTLTHVIVPSRAFLNEICTDIILFKNQKLKYYRGKFTFFHSLIVSLIVSTGNYDIFESTRREASVVSLFVRSVPIIIYRGMTLCFACVLFSE